MGIFKLFCIIVNISPMSAIFFCGRMKLNILPLHCGKETRVFRTQSINLLWPSFCPYVGKGPFRVQQKFRNSHYSQRKETL